MTLSVPTTAVAYFSMEIGLEPTIPTYSGGLGVLAGDTIRAAADVGLPMVAITLAHRKGYFHQHLDGDAALQFFAIHRARVHGRIDKAREQQ